jgi:hypothetical protein
MNFPLIMFDILCLPIIIVRLILIYFFGSKYSIEKMEFLDVMLHANNPYFNQEEGASIDILNEDIRATIKRETKIYSDNVDNTISTLENKTKNRNIDILDSDYEKESNSRHNLQLDDDIEIIDSESHSSSENEIVGTEMSESETVLDINTDESHITTETEIVSKNMMNKNTKFNLDDHIDQLFDDLENSVTTMTQSSHMV